MKKEDKKFSKQEKKFLDMVDVDYVALCEIVGYIVMGTNKYIPTEKDYLDALEFIEYLIDKYKDRLQCLKGVEFQKINMTNEKFIKWLKEMWYAGKYEDIDYGVWFDLDEEKN